MEDATNGAKFQRNTISKKLEESEMQYEINRMTTERNYHITQTHIFDEAIKRKKQELKNVHEPEDFSNGETYK